MSIRDRTCARRLSTGFGVTSAVILCALICLGSARGQGTTTKAERGFEAIPDSPATTQGHRYVVAIGVNDYANWPKLATAVSDATGFAELLQKQFGYELPVPPLTDKQVTRQAVELLIDDELRAKMKPDDDLIIFFAGHGTTRTDTTGDLVTKAGFLVPYDAHEPGVGERWSDYINVDELLRMVSSLHARHILVILDSCHSGLALGAGFSSSRGLEHLSEDMSRKVSRKVIASAEGDQLAADSGPLPGHSLFTGLLMQGLMSGKADNFAQGFVTSTQLGAFVQHEVSVAEASRQTPLFGAFYRDEAGELILPTTAPQSFSDLFSAAYAAMEKGDYERFRTLADQAKRMKPDSPEALWLRFKEDTLIDTKAKAELQELSARLEKKPFTALPVPPEVKEILDAQARKSELSVIDIIPPTNDAFKVFWLQKDGTKLALENNSTIATRDGGQLVAENISGESLSFTLAMDDPHGGRSLLDFGYIGDAILPGKSVASRSFRTDGRDDVTHFHVISTPIPYSDVIAKCRLLSWDQVADLLKANDVRQVQFDLHTLAAK